MGRVRGVACARDRAGRAFRALHSNLLVMADGYGYEYGHDILTASNFGCSNLVMGYHIDLAIDITSSEIRDRIIPKALPFVNGVKGITIGIKGFNEDSRELWEIPEVCDFMRMLVAEGMLSILKMPERKSQPT